MAASSNPSSHSPSNNSTANGSGANGKAAAPMSATQASIQAKGEAIFAMMESEGKSVFNKDWWYGRIMESSMKNERFKTQMFRFVDVLPYLNTGAEVARHLKEYFAEGGDELPSILNVGVGIGSLAPGLMAGAIRKQVTGMAKMFITGETPQEALGVLKKARKNKIAFTVDLLGEACLSDSEALDYQKKYLELVSWLSEDAKKWDSVPQIDADDRGPIPRVNVSVKLTALYSQIDVKAWDKSKAAAKDRLRTVFQLGLQQGAAITLDMEQYELKDFTIAVFRELLEEPAFKAYPHFGCVLQAYLRDAPKDVADMIAFAKKRGVAIPIRLVKGAYWDFETVQSAQAGWPVPVFTNKRESDACYEECALLMLQNVQHVRPQFASHNVRTISAAMVHAERLGVDPRAYEVQMLYGMGDPIKASLVRLGVRVREYAPVGELIPGMAYLVRRLLENTSNESFLRSKFSDGVSAEKLLADPAAGLQPSSSAPPAPAGQFINDPLIDFGIEANRAKMKKTLAEEGAALGKDHPITIGGKDLTTARWIESFDPSHPARLVGRVAVAGIPEADQAMAAARSAFASWRLVSADKRADLVDKLADVFQRDRYKIIALEVYEAGKQWEEADGDVAEAIDFCRYYAREMRKLNKPKKMGWAPGETSLYHYRPRGVSVVIAPWNFPLAILCGMVAGSVVTGNTCVMKPAEQTCVIGAYLMRALKDAGFPPGVVNFLNGYGEEIGAHLVAHKDTAQICFTGSKAVGLGIVETAGKTLKGQESVKRVICEMGGKNAIIIDSDADLDEAVVGVLYSAFGFQGQKCSAASRVIVVDEIYDRFVPRLIEAAKNLPVLAAEEPDCFVGPVIDQEARDRILKMIEVGKTEAKLAFQGATPAEGWFAPPTIFTDAKPDSRIAQEEIFGPVMAVIRAADIDEALKIANGVEYALTGGIYSRSPANIEKAKDAFEVGNLYINRGCTGAMVVRHPFGGFKMSGLGSKTGGPDYLVQFMDPRVTTENTLRRGFAPAEENPEGI